MKEILEIINGLVSTIGGLQEKITKIEKELEEIKQGISNPKEPSPNLTPEQIQQQIQHTKAYMHLKGVAGVDIEEYL